MKLSINGKKISKAKLEEMVGKDRSDRMIKEAKEAFREDPEEQISFFLGSHGMLNIEFDF